MDTNAYNVHKEQLKELAMKYSDKGEYPDGINSDNADLSDKIEYWGSLNYTYLYHLHKAVKTDNEKKTEQLRIKVKETLKKLEECESKLGIIGNNINFRIFLMSFPI